MSFIQGIGSSTPINNPTLGAPVKPPSNESANTPPTDRVELSGIGHLLSKLKSNDIRTDKVASVKSAINDGSYEDDHKLNVAIDKLLDDLNK
jgi:anti-sigma28 factor (negative regulator of flagellin synthesis)